MFIIFNFILFFVVAIVSTSITNKQGKTNKQDIVKLQSVGGLQPGNLR